MNAYKQFIVSLWIIALCMVTGASYALPFIIQTKAGTSLPTEVTAGNPVLAYMTVKNNTNSVRKDNFVKWLPPNVTQVFGASFCGKKFNLPAKGSCTLALSINGVVNAKDPDPHHHLFVCFSDRTTCAGPQPNSVLNVRVINFSLAGGPYYTNQGYFPLIARSTDNGSTWVYPVMANKPSSLPGNISPYSQTFPRNNYFGTSSCSGTLCAMGGSYLAGSITYPMLALSKDGGVTWTYPINSATVLPGTMSPSNTGFAGVINGVYCAGSLCAAVGQYHTTQGDFPLLALTLDAGGTWTYPINANQLPSGAVANTSGFVGTFQKVTCSGTRCLAVGQYNINSVGNGQRYPLLALTTNSGASWSYPLGAQSTYPGGIIVPPSGGAGSFTRVNCVGPKCTLAGTYRSSGSLGNGIYLILGYSNDGGTSWSFPVSSQSTFPSNAASSGSVQDINCSNNLCIAAGAYATNTKLLPFVMISKNNGLTWSYVVQDGENLPAANVEGYANSATSSGTLCIVAGGYTIDNTAAYPFVLQSRNGGLNWEYVVDKNHLPADAKPDLNLGTSMNSSASAPPYAMAGGYYYNGVGYYPLRAVTQNGGASWSFPVSSKQSSLPTDAVAEPTGELNFFGTATTP